ncbi:FAD-binding oxidoreductase [Orrella marina]|uniref:Hydroxyacid dehydrogenase n=1 Tax=Orrella marina TaxID=2163011 RepID=A0A2R4XJD8_9BURK|nr:FAD-binding oxidoreductase [Orrella marina]AWB33888.1 hydroxyacid dehydrogenase [Orrella marina]
MNHQSLVGQFAHIVGPDGIISDKTEHDAYVRDWLGKWTGLTPVVVRPRSTTEVSAVLRLCHQTHTPVVTQGGNTGMSGAATPDTSNSQVVLSLTRMKRIRDVDPINNTMTVDAGVTLAQVQQVATDADRLFPLSLGAQGSCTIGGNVATNAGGSGVLRYGNTRDLVLGLEVVLPDGRVWNGLRALRKDNTGYDLKHLFIGSEGTLGVVTAAVLKMYPAVRNRQTAWIGFERLADVVDALRGLQDICGDSLTAFEMMTQASLDLVLGHFNSARSPLQSPVAFHVLAEVSHTSATAATTPFEDALQALIERGLAVDVALASSTAQAVEMWGLREGISPAQVAAGHAIKHDIALPISSIPQFVQEADSICADVRPEFTVINFGHIGDGNLHYNVLAPASLGEKSYKQAVEQLNRLIHDLVAQYGGSISAEHGVGQLRRDELKRYKSSVEMDLMMTIKRSLDPNHLMNPGKLL